MRYLAVSVLAVLIISFCSGCVIAPVVPPTGYVFNQTRAPISTEFRETPIGSKSGESSASSVLFGLFAFGDCSIQSAARNGNLSKIYHADYEFFNILGLYTKTTVIVVGD